MFASNAFGNISRACRFFVPESVSQISSCVPPNTRETQLAFGDLLKFRLSDKYKHPLHRALFALYPRWLVRTLGDRFGLCLFVEATK